MINLLSLFSGIGAFERALENLNIPFNLVAYSEIDKYAAKAYAILHCNGDESLNLGDIRNIDTSKLKNIDMVTYGFPCQDISISGKMRSLSTIDPTTGKEIPTRSGLVWNAHKIIQDTQPKFAICENVKNLTSKRFTKEFNAILQNLENIGYNNYYKVLNAKDFEIPQNRERIFIISIRKDIDKGTFRFPEATPLKLRLKDILLDDVNEKYFIKDEKALPFIEEHVKSEDVCKVINE